MTELRIPVTTYRLQFTADFGFDEAISLIPYLEALGITDLYASPLLLAREGSEHGYDVVDPRRIDPGVGGRSGFADMWETLKNRKMGLLLDIVPNHMAATPENPWWRDILRWGPHSVHAPKFDINWEAQQEQDGITGKLVLPILGAPLQEVLDREELKLALGKDGFQIHYHEHHLPVYPGTYTLILSEWEHCQGENIGKTELAETLEALENGNWENPDTNTMAKGVEAGKRFWELHHGRGQSKEYLDRVLHHWNKGAGSERFQALLDAQHYRLVFWRDGREQVNYRRFFDINDLVTLRIEDEDVFRSVHSRVLELVRDGAVTGLRIDHVDGLHDPEDYLVRLQKNLATLHSAGTAAAVITGSSARTGELAKKFYVIVEKILEKDETLPQNWPVAGTTGYDFMNILTGLFVDNDGLNRLDKLYQSLRGACKDFAQLVNTQKKQVMSDLFGGEMAELTEQLMDLAAHDPRGRELVREDLEAALVGVTAAFPVYRSYIRGFSVTQRDRQYIDEALNTAAAFGDGSDVARAFLNRLLLLKFAGEAEEETQREWLRFVMRWQQFTGPIMAKGFEDTSLYIYNRLLSLNEVGSDPAEGTVGVKEFHQRMLARHAHMPHTLSATSTHDTKRSEDVRARINVLTEIPGFWEKQFHQWQEWNTPHKIQSAGRLIPDSNEELLLYQTLLGAWPLDSWEETEFVERLAEYLVKASREAKQHSNWLEPNEEYEQAFCNFARRILDQSTVNRFREEMKHLAKLLAYYGAMNSLSQVVLKTVCPGVPDFYMGCELWDYSLVDPDNRRPVDFDRHSKMLNELQQAETGTKLTGELLESWQDGRLKMYVTWKGLSLRREKANLFTWGGYSPVEASGPARKHVCALARHGDGEWVLAAVVRFPFRLAAGAEKGPPEIKASSHRGYWLDTVLNLPDGAPACWRNIFTGEIINAAGQTLPLSQVLANFPVALLTPEDKPAKK